MAAPSRHTGHRWYTWPAIGLWRAASAVEHRLGIARTLLFGLALLTLGLLCCLTFVGILAGIPAMILGAFLILRALY